MYTHIENNAAIEKVAVRFLQKIRRIHCLQDERWLFGECPWYEAELFRKKRRVEAAGMLAKHEAAHQQAQGNAEKWLVEGSILSTCIHSRCMTKCNYIHVLSP